MKNIPPKQQHFIDEYLKTSNATRAAMAAYGYKDPGVASAAGSRLLGFVRVKEAIKQGLQGSGIDTALVLNTLRKNLVEGAGVKARASDSNRAAELLLKVSGHLSKDHALNNTPNYTLNLLTGLSYTQLLEKRKEMRLFFDDILEGEIVNGTHPKSLNEKDQKPPL